MAARKAKAKQRQCERCRKPLALKGRGRPRRYCSDACRQAGHRRRVDGEQKRGLITLYEGDARDLLPGLPDGSVDLIVTDPPYVFERGDSRFREWFVPIDDGEWPAIFTELYRVLAADAHAYVFGDRRVRSVFEDVARRAGFRVHHPLVWDKCSIGLGGAYRSQHEFIGFFEKGRRAPNFKNLGDVRRAPRVRGYPTEKPVPVLQTLISQSSDPGEVVLDPFCGSGNTGRAARELRRRAWLCDIDTAVASSRLRNAAVPVEAAVP